MEAFRCPDKIFQGERKNIESKIKSISLKIIFWLVLNLLSNLKNLLVHLKAAKKINDAWFFLLQKKIVTAISTQLNVFIHPFDSKPENFETLP